MNSVEFGEDLLLALEGRGWRIVRGDSPEPLLPPEVRQRYPRVPEALSSFLDRLESCTNDDENIWFSCRAEFRRTDDEGFRWNEFELMSLEGANGDPEAQAQVRGFWDRHFPFMVAVHSDYDYLAVDLDERSYGQVVHGSGPEFEETLAVAPSVVEFMDLFRHAAAGSRADYPLSYFL